MQVTHWNKEIFFKIKTAQKKILVVSLKGEPKIFLGYVILSFFHVIYT